MRHFLAKVDYCLKTGYNWLMTQEVQVDLDKMKENLNGYNIRKISR